MLWSVRHSAELLVAPSSGWRRPFALHVAAPDTFSAAVTRGEAIAVHLQWPSAYPDANERMPTPGARSTLSRGDVTKHHADLNARQHVARAASDRLFPGAALTLQAQYHGREVHASACIQITKEMRAVVTASEDSTVRCMVTRHATACSPLAQHALQP